MLRFIYLLSILFISCQENSVDIYVATNGNDSGNGSIENPLKSLEKAAEISQKYAGKKAVNVVFEDGIYYMDNTLKLTNTNSGSAQYPVVWKAKNEGKVILSGGAKLNLKWEPYKDGIYQAVIDEDVSIDQLYINGVRQRMARFPNAKEGKNVFDSWDLIHTSKPDLDQDPLDHNRISKWNNPKGAYVHAMHKALWGDMHWLVKGKLEDGTLDLEGGWQNNRPSPVHPRYRMVENIFEELDVAGEWFFNKGDKTLFYYPKVDLDLATAKVEIVRLKHLIELTGGKDNSVRFIKFEGFVFRHAARSFMENKEQLLRSDWTTYRGGAVVFDGAEDCSILNCEFDQLGGNAIFVNNYNRRILIKSCYIHHSGANGIAFVGDPNAVRDPLFRYGKQDFTKISRIPGPKNDNYPEDCRVEDCLITMTGRDEKQTSPIQISMSHKITVNHCSIYDVPRAGINISEGTFGGHIIEYCDVFNTVLETGDHGSFNSWGRDRFWTPNGNETAAEVKLDSALVKLDMLDPNIIRNSRWRCDHGWDIDLDDGSSWYRLYNNVLLNGGLKMREGYDRIATNNVIINNSLHPHVWYPNSGDVFKHNIVFGAYRPAVMQRCLAIDDKWGMELDSNLFASHELDRVKYAQNDCDDNSLVGNPVFENAEEGNYRVADDSKAIEIGFTNFPMDEFGVISPALKKIAKKPVIPVALLDTQTSSGKIHKWWGGKVKNIESLGEQSAAGLPSMSGVVVLEVPKKSKLADKGFLVGDVILKLGRLDIRTFPQLENHLFNEKKSSAKKFEIMRNQSVENLLVEE